MKANVEREQRANKNLSMYMFLGDPSLWKTSYPIGWYLVAYVTFNSFDTFM